MVELYLEKEKRYIDVSLFSMIKAVFYAQLAIVGLIVGTVFAVGVILGVLSYLFPIS